MPHESSELTGHGSTPLRFSECPSHIGWFHGLGKRVFGYHMNLFGLENLVQGPGKHLVGLLSLTCILRDGLFVVVTQLQSMCSG